MSSIASAPQVLGAALVVATEAALAALNVDGMTLGTEVYVSGTDKTFSLRVSSATLAAGSVVAVANISGVRWLLVGVQITGQTAFPNGTDVAPSVQVGPAADQVGLANVANQLRLCAAGVCGFSVSAGGQSNLLGPVQHFGATLGFYNGAQTAQQSVTAVAGSAALTNNATGGTANVIATFAGSTYATDAPIILGDINQLARRIAALETLIKATTLVAA
jgi:hypothetical protein